MAVGRPVPRIDAVEKVTGKARFADDVSFPGMLHAKVLRSTRASARILRLDVSAARALEGVEVVITANDIPGENACHVVEDDQPFLADGIVRYHGEAIAVVAARTRAIAEKAVGLIIVEYEDLPGVFHPVEAMKDGAHQVQEDRDNVISHFRVVKGDAAKAMETADIIVEGEYSTNYQEHAYIEPQGATVVPNADGSVTVYATCQCPFYVQTGVAQGLGLPLAKVRVIQTVTGGGFGGKEDYPSLLSGYAGFAALATGRPVKLIYTREEDLQCSSKRHPSVSKFRTGVMKDGTIVAQEVEYILDAGAYVTLTGVVLFRGNAHAIGAYDVANVKVDSYGVLTNRVPCGAYRGFGSPQIIFAGETHMDAIADKLGMDPLELRRKNALGIGKRTMTDHLIEESCGFAECIDEATLSSEWGAKRAEYDAQPLDVRKRRGIGCATIYYGVGLGATGKVLDKSGALVQVHADGSVLVAVGTTDMGQGHKTVMAQFAAEELGIDVGRITVIEVDTALVPDSGPTVASRSTLMSGRAVMDGCRQIRERMAELACKKLGCDEVEFAEGQVTPKGGGEGMAFNALALQCWLELVHLAASGFFRTPATSWDEETGLGELYVTYSWATDIAEVEVDMETGEVTVLSIVAAHDVGRAVNPMAVEGQIEGGAVQGMGYAMMEDLVSENGVILNPGLNDYLVPTTKDAPVITPIIVEHPYPRGPHGAKGIGEPSLMAAPGAVTNAISHAIGARVNDLPVTQERIVRAIKGR